MDLGDSNRPRLRSSWAASTSSSSRSASSSQTDMPGQLTWNGRLTAAPVE